jgi:uncharacterized integral membrane protein (TIGR00698 family)
MNPLTPLPPAPVLPQTSQRFAGLGRLLPGLALSIALAEVAMLSSRVVWFATHGLSALTVAIVLGILLGNTVYGRIAATSGPGVSFSKQILLRAGVVLYGLRLTLGGVASIGFPAVVIDVLVLTSTFGLAWLLGPRLFGLDRVTSMLIGAGSAICGAAAVMATEPVVKGKAEQVTVAIAGVVVFGTLAIFLYPALYLLNAHWSVLPAGDQAFGIYAGSTIHELAQVFAAGHSISAAAADTAVITKMVRVMMLAPFLVGLSAWLSREARRQAAGSSPEPATRRKVAIPWFAFGFIGVVAFNSLSPLPGRVTGIAVSLDTFLLAMAMAALGLTTHLSAIRQTGIRPFLLACLLFAWLVVGGAAINCLVAFTLH